MEGVAEIESRDIIEEAGFQVIPPNEFNIPSSYDLSRFSEDKRKDVDGAIQMFNRFLKAPTISDNWENNRKREKMIGELREKVRTEKGEEEVRKVNLLLESNKMKRNKLGTLEEFAEILEADGIVPTLAKELRGLIRKNVLPHVPLEDVQRLIGEVPEEDAKKLRLIVEKGQYDEHGVVYKDIRFFIPSSPKKVYKYSVIDPWDGPTTDKKIAIVGEISKKVADILNFLGKKD